MRFSVLFIFLLIIGAAILWQNRPQEDQFEAAGKQIIQKMKREAALKEYRESMDLEDRKKETEKLKRKYPLLLDKCLEIAQYKRSNLHVHDFADGSRLAFCAPSGGIDLNKFIGSVYYQPHSKELPQIFNLGTVADGPVGFESRPVSISFKFDGFYADTAIFFKDANIPALRLTYNCSRVTKECFSDKREKCIFSKSDRKNDEHIAKFKLDQNELFRIDDRDKDNYQKFFDAILGKRDAERALLRAPTDGEVEDTQLVELMQKDLKRFRRAGCL